MQPTEKQPKQVEDREPLPESHPAFLQELKQRIRESQVRVFLSVNRELVMLYWRIGRDILIRQKRENWGAKIIDRLVADLKKVFPEMKGFSPRNLKYMRAWRKRNLCNRLLHKFPWGHNVRILDCLKDRSAREWYVKAHLRTRMEPQCLSSPSGKRGTEARWSRSYEL